MSGRKSYRGHNYQTIERIVVYDDEGISAIKGVCVQAFSGDRTSEMPSAEQSQVCTFQGRFHIIKSSGLFVAVIPEFREVF